MQMHGVQQQLKDLAHLGAIAFGQKMLMLIAMLDVHSYIIQCHNFTGISRRIA